MKYDRADLAKADKFPPKLKDPIAESIRLHWARSPAHVAVDAFVCDPEKKMQETKKKAARP